MLRVYDKIKKEYTIIDDGSSWGKVQTPQMKLEVKEMMEEAERRELAKKSFEELTREERIKLALEEVDWIVIGGQDGEEFYNSIQFIRKVLKSLR